MAGMGSVGGAAAAGVESGFNMGMRLDEQAERRRATALNEARTARLDTEHADQLARTNKRQDTQDEYAEDDRVLKTVDEERTQHALAGAGLAQQYGGPHNIPAVEGQAYATKAAEINSRRLTVLQKRYAPVVKREQQWAQDTASRIEAGQMSMDDLSPADTVRLIQINARRPIADFLRDPASGKSRVGGAIADTTAGIQTKNNGLVTQGAGVLLSPELQIGLGHTAPDGSEIVKKDLAGLVPAPQQATPPAAPKVNPIQGLAAALNGATGAAPPPEDSPAPGGAMPPQGDAQASPVPGVPPLQPGSGDTVMPVLNVTARHADGTEVTYHAPVTKGRGTGPGDEVHPGFKMADAMDHMGKLSVLEGWANTPAARAKIEQGLKDLGGGANSFLGAYYAMHGDAKALLPPGSDDPTSKKIEAIQRFAKAKNITFAEAARQLDGKGAHGALEGKLEAIRNDTSLTPDEKVKATKIAYGLEKVATPKASDANYVALTPEAIDQTARAAMNDRTALTGLGRDPNKISAVLNRMEELTKGGDIAGNRVAFGADKKSLEKLIPQYDAVVAFENNTVQQGKVLVDLAKKVDTTGMPVVERWIRGGRQNIPGDADVSEFNAQLSLFGTEAAKILTNPNLTGVLTDSARHEVAEFLPKSASAAQIERIVTRLEADFHIRKQSLEEQTATITKRMADRVPAVTETSGRGVGSRVDPKTQAARDSDRGPIMRQELADAQKRLAAGDTRAQGDIDALQREISALPATKVPQGKGTGLSGDKKPTTATFADEAAAAAAAKAGKLKPGDRITIGGQTGTWQ